MPIEPTSALGIELEQFRGMRVALIHDWLLTYRGGERVLEAIAELFPSADIYTLVHRTEKLGGQLKGHRIHASRLSSLPRVEKYYRWLLPVFPLAIESFDLTGYDLIVSSSHCVAKGVIPAPQALHLTYCHTTMRYAWDQQSEYFKGWKRAVFHPILHYLRLWDTASSSRVDRFIANSHFVADRIDKYYRREASVVHPFVDLKGFELNTGVRGDHYLCVSALVPYKKIDLAVQACLQTGRKLRVVGDGPELQKLKRLGDGRIEFLGSLTPQQLAAEYRSAKAFLFPGIEDFGITPLEAMACGTPVIGLGQGGLLDSVVDNVTGLFFARSETSSLIEAIERFERSSWDPFSCRSRAERFSKARFQEGFLREVGIAHRRSTPDSATKRSNLSDAGEAHRRTELTESSR